MPSTPRKTFKNRIHGRVAAATLAAFALALGVVTFAGAPLPTTTAASGTRAAHAEFVTDDGVYAPASTWIVSARAPG